MAGENINRRLNIYINDKEVVNSMSGITREMGKTRNELRNLNKNSEDYQERLGKLTKHLSDLAEKQDEFRDELKLTNKEMSSARENFSNLLGGLATGDMNGVQTAMMGIRGSIVATTQAAWAFVATPVGAFVAAFVGLGLAAKQVADFNESIKESNQLLDSLGVDTKLRPAIQGIADTYKVGFEDLANAIDNMVDLGLVKNEFEALDKIKEGLLKAPDKNAFLATLDANGVAAKNLGLHLEDVISLNESFEATGANAEKIFGALQKSSSTLILQSPQLRKSLENAFGSAFTSELLNKVKTGEITYYDALNRIHKKGEEIGLSNQKQAQLAKELFGKSSTAAGGYEMILGNIARAQEKNLKPLTETQKQVQKLAESNIELAEAQDRALKLDGYNRWKNNALLALNVVKTAWYDMLSGLMNSKADIIAASKKEGDANLLKDKEALFNDYMDRRKKRMGADFDWEKERAEHLESVLSDKKKYATTNAQKKAYNTEIEVIKRAKKPKEIDLKAGAEQTDDEKKSAEDVAKKREKALENAKKHSEDLLKIENDLQNSLNESRTKASELKSGLIKDDYIREKALINAEYDKKIEDLELNIKKEQEAIDRLKKGIASPKTSNEDLVSFKKQLKDRLEIQQNFNQAMLFTDQNRDLKLGALQEKYLEKSFQKQQEKSSRDLQNLKTKQTLELSEITSLEQAKAILAETLSSEELSRITTLEKAKTAIKKENLKEQYDLELKNLNDLVTLLETSLTPNESNGFTLISDEEREKVTKFLDDAKAKIAEIKGNKTDAETPEKTEGVDVLGINSNEWEEIFANLDTFEGKLRGLQAVAGALTNVFGAYFKFLEAGEARTLQKFQRSADSKKKHLSDQLEKGVISQEVYNARVAKIDAELAKKKAEIEYKQAKRQKAMAIVNAVINTAVGIMQAYAQLGPFGTVAAALIGTMGALEVATIAKQPLPDKNGFKDGGYTGDGPNTGEAGPAHFREYVVPEDVLFSNDPVVPNIVGYLEQKRTGKQPVSPSDDSSQPKSGSQSGSSTSSADTAVIIALNRNSEVLEKIEENGLQAFLVNDIPSAKKIRDKIKELTKLETKQKA